MNRRFIKLLPLLLAMILTLSACGSAPDSKEDPLATFDVNAVLPFATASPEIIQATPTPAPTIAANDATTAPLDWQKDKLPDEVVAQQNDAGSAEDNYTPPAATVRATQKPASSSSKYTSLRKGDESSAVKKLQQQLKDLGYYSSNVNGRFGDATVAAVKRFQGAVGLEATGIATADTQRELFSNSAPRFKATPAPTKRPSSTQAPEYYTLSFGASGPEVWDLQQRLKDLGFYASIIDGRYGSGTQNAVKRFQKSIDYEQTGVATGSLQKIIFAKNAPTYKPAATAAATASSTTEYVTLSEGASGTKVKNLQARLKELGYFDGDIGGNYQSKTVQAVKRFQSAIGETTDGIATVALQKRIFAADAPVHANGASGTVTSPPSGDAFIELSNGASGSRVEELQRRLKELGYLGGSVDGNFGDSTAKAVMLFERAYNKAETGIATVALQKKLFASDAKQNPAAASTATETDYVTLKRNATGEQVKALQRRLKELGYFDGDIGGNYLDKTEAAVKRFQQAIGESADGVATVALQKRIFAADAPAYGNAGSNASSADYQSLSKGASGSGVENLQRRLKELKYYSGSIDGSFGDSTAKAVMLFERACGQSETGIATVNMQKTLFSESAKANTETAPEEIKKGSEGEHVYVLQLRLIELGFLNAEDITEGTYDRPTYDAVIAAQTASKYKNQDGVATTEFLEYLYSDKAYEISLVEYGN